MPPLSPKILYSFPGIFSLRFAVPGTTVRGLLQACLASSGGVNPAIPLAWFQEVPWEGVGVAEAIALFLAPTVCPPGPATPATGRRTGNVPCEAGLACPRPASNPS
jgi:hypothetical protein